MIRITAIIAVFVSGCVGEVVSEPAAEDEDVGAAEAELAWSLRANRDRLLDTYAARMGKGRCATWNGMSTSQQGVFLTITDLLGKRSWLYNDRYTYTLNNGIQCPAYQYDTDCTHGCYVPHEWDYTRCQWIDGETCYWQGQCDRTQAARTGSHAETALDHVTRIWAVNGAGSGCGGGDDNRMYVSMDWILTSYMRNFEFGLPGWGDSTDLMGPHSPFTNSSETFHGQPRGQSHFWRWDWEARTLWRRGVEGVYDPNILEIDIDYNWKHDSNPECYYGGTYGRWKYQNKWWGQGVGGSAELYYRPTGC